MIYSRRSFMGFSLGSAIALTAPRLLGQIANHQAAQVPRQAPSGRPFNAHFVDVGAAAGLHEPTIYGDVETNKYILESDGCGCAFIDYDNDGWMDIFLLCGTRLEGAPSVATNRLYKNNRDGTFSDVTEKAGLHAVGWANGVCVGDYNNDGFEDMFVTYFGQNRLYRNNGDGTFTDVTEAAGLLNDPTRWGAGCSFLDYNRDGHLDLFVSNYVHFDLAHALPPGGSCNFKGIPVECGPMGLPVGYPSLYRNKGDGTFTDVTEQAGIAKATKCYGMTVVAADLDGDGWTDIYVACDSTPSLLFMNNHDGTFREEGVLRGSALSENGELQAGMGVGIGDYALEGRLDLFKTHFVADAPALYHNDGKGYFDDVTTESRVGVETRYVCWGAGIFDLDNDGYPDLFMVTGNVYPEIERALPQYPNKGPRVVFRNLGNGTFEELINAAGPGVADLHSSRGCAFGDFDNDGDIDMLVINMNESPSLLRNDIRGKQNWIKVKLEGVKSNRSAIGARVLAHYGGKTQAQCIVSQSSYYSFNDTRLHFGLGNFSSVDVDVHWPNGLVESFKRLPINELVTLREGVGRVPNRGWSKT